MRYCVWLAPDERTLKSVFVDLDISFESIIEVEETVPDLWGKRWKEHLAADEPETILNVPGAIKNPVVHRYGSPRNKNVFFVYFVIFVVINSLPQKAQILYIKDQMVRLFPLTH